MKKIVSLMGVVFLGTSISSYAVSCKSNKYYPSITLMSKDEVFEVFENSLLSTQYKYANKKEITDTYIDAYKYNFYILFDKDIQPVRNGYYLNLEFLSETSLTWEVKLNIEDINDKDGYYKIDEDSNVARNFSLPKTNVERIYLDNYFFELKGPGSIQVKVTNFADLYNVQLDTSSKTITDNKSYLKDANFDKKNLGTINFDFNKNDTKEDLYFDFKIRASNCERPVILDVYLLANTQNK
ncbi:hypothetical protein SHELI_v1c04180 [Spiroplasma helicoides]|uniref:Lipoprotein n=1 Tax=Spiroplasma helicoides TaxID=216938 RepID=A0A1B3SKB4_9MOLU|nr:hypothetical protein [Spiroplasma helicoides]AOG60369.1 hypothetical protein SHELI_v1c04180 [Spiroplasma helicoides]